MMESSHSETDVQKTPRPDYIQENLDRNKDVDKPKQTSRHYVDPDMDLENMDIDVEEILARTSRSFGPRRVAPMLEAPEFVKRLNAFEEVTVGSTVEFACQWRAFPRPSIHWYKDDEDITENGHYTLETEDQTGLLRLVIPRAVKNDEGAYKCKAENQDGVASTTGYLSVTGNDDRTLASQKKQKQQQQQQQQQQHNGSDDEYYDGEEDPEELLRKAQADRLVSLPPHLRTIVEQKSLEEREEVEYADMPPSPLQEFIDNFRRTKSWPGAPQGYHREKDDDEISSGSDTSVESQQDYDPVNFEARKSEMDDVMNGIDGDVAETTHDVTGKPHPSSRTAGSGACGAHASNSDSLLLVPSPSAGKRSSGSRKRRAARRTCSLDLTSALLDILDSPWLYFLPLVTGASSFAAATELNPLIMIVFVALASLIGFRLFLHQERQTTT